jgi:hypothetical protein
MPRWVAIDETAVRKGKNTAVLAAVRAKAASNADADPLPDMIEDVTAMLRTAVQAGNTLDSDETMIPAGLKELGVRLVVVALYSYIELPLSTDDAAQARSDQSYINRIIDKRLRFPAADNPDATQPNPNKGNWNSENKIVMRTHPVPRAGAQFTPPANTYANPEGGSDTGNDVP